MAGRSRGNDEQTVLIRKEEVVEGGHHGGNWKIAYADFVTAMMAFFLLMWLINATSEEQRRGLADYFSKSNIFSHQTSGSGRPFGGKTPFEDGTMVSDRGTEQVVVGNAEAIPDVDEDNADTPAQIQPDPEPNDDLSPGGKNVTGSGQGLPGNARTYSPEQGRPQTGTSGPAAAAGGAAVSPSSPAPSSAPPAAAASPVTAPPPPPPPSARAQESANAGAAEEAALRQTAEEIKRAVESDPALRDLARQLAIDETPEGLRIQILDADKRPMFDLGASTPNAAATELIRKIAPILAKLPEKLSIGGYTDAAPYHGGGKTNWDLSTERANATRRLLVESGLADNRFESVTGHADRDLLLPADPLAAANRRVAIVVLRNHPLPHRRLSASSGTLQNPAPASPPAGTTPVSSSQTPP